MNKVISLYFDTDLHQQVKRRAEQQQRTLSAHIRWLVKQDLARCDLSQLPKPKPERRGRPVKVEEDPWKDRLPVPPAFPRPGDP